MAAFSGPPVWEGWTVAQGNWHVVAAANSGKQPNATRVQLLWRGRKGKIDEKCRATRQPRAAESVPTLVGREDEKGPRARLWASRKEEVEVEEQQKPLAEYMRLPASQYSVLDAERIERIDDSTFRCYVHRLQFFALEVCPVLLLNVKLVEDGCCISLLSCTLEGSPIVVAQNDKFSAAMTNHVTWAPSPSPAAKPRLMSNTSIEK